MAFYVFDGTHFYVTAAIGPAESGTAPGTTSRVFDGRRCGCSSTAGLVGDPIAAPPTIAYALTSSDHYIGTLQGSCALPLQGDVDLIRRGTAVAPDFIGALADSALLVPRRPARRSGRRLGPCRSPRTPTAGATRRRAGDRSAPIAPGTSSRHQAAR